LRSETTERKSAFGLARAQVSPKVRLSRCFSRSPIGALIDLVVWCRLCSQIPACIDLGTLTHLRITVLPHRRSTCPGYVWGLGLHPGVIEHVPYIGTVRDERNNAHLAAAQWA
jgi:hypothetical protein